MKPSRGLRPGATGSRSAGSLSASQRVLGRILRRPLGLVPTATPGGSVTHLNTRFMRNGIVMLVLVAATSALLYALIQPAQSSPKAYSDFYSDVTKGQVSKVSIQESTMKVTLKDGTTTYTVQSDLPAEGEFTTIKGWLQGAGLPVSAIKYERTPPPDTGWIALLLTLIHISEPTRLGMISYAV